MRPTCQFWLSVLLVAGAIPLTAAPASKLAAIGPDGRLQYTAYSGQGDTLPGFSHCGYGGGGVPLPVAAVQATLEPLAGDADDTPRIQQLTDRKTATGRTN